MNNKRGQGFLPVHQESQFCSPGIGIPLKMHKESVEFLLVEAVPRRLDINTPFSVKSLAPTIQ